MLGSTALTCRIGVDLLIIIVFCFAELAVEIAVATDKKHERYCQDRFGAECRSDVLLVLCWLLRLLSDWPQKSQRVSEVAELPGEEAHSQDDRRGPAIEPGTRQGDVQ